ncbi:hypothetical protein Tco_1084935, partial [Tanacetum coccineum]
PGDVARECRPGRNLIRAFPFHLSRATCRPGKLSPADLSLRIVANVVVNTSKFHFETSTWLLTTFQNSTVWYAVASRRLDIKISGQGPQSS